MPRKEYSMPAKVFLASYNAFQLFGWTRIFFLMAISLVSGSKIGELYGIVRAPLNFYQWIMLVEILYTLVGLIPGQPHLTFMQLWGRVFSLYCIEYVPESFGLKESYVTVMMVTAWSLSEITRYPFYLLKLFDVEIYFISYFRYTNFMFLYPPGVSGEWLTQWKSIPYFLQFSIHFLPEVVKYGHLIYVTAAFYPIGFAMLFFYLLGARKKFFRDSKKKEE